MSFWYRFKEAFRRFMTGRNGSDELSSALLITALVLMLLASFTGILLLDLIALAIYFFSLFRIFSRKVEKRYAENQKYLSVRLKAKTSLSQRWVRLKNSKKYKYFKCPQCHSWLRLPRGVGDVTVTCGKCRHAFKKKG